MHKLYHELSVSEGKALKWNKQTFVLTVEGALPAAPAECVGLGVSLTIWQGTQSKSIKSRVEGDGHTRRTKYLWTSRKVDRQYMSARLVSETWVEQTFRLETKKTRQLALIQRRSIIMIDQSRRYIQHHPYPSSHFPAKSFYLELLHSVGPPNSEANWHENGVLTIFRCFLDGFWAVWRLVERSKSANRRIGIRMWLIEIQRHSRA